MIESMRRNVLKVLTGTALGQGIVLAVSPILTRMYEPSDFGVAGIYAAIISVGIVVSSLKYDTAIPLPADDRVAFSLVGVSAGIVLVLCAGLFLLVMASGEQLLSLVSPEVASYGYWVVAGVLMGSSFQILSYWAVRRREYGAIATTKATQGFGTAITQVALGVFSGPIGLILGDIVGRSAGSLYLLRRSGLKPSAFKEMVPVAQAANEYRNFPLISAPGGLLNAVGLNIPSVIVSAQWGLGAAGAFVIVQRVFGAPMALLGRSVVQVYFGEAAGCVKSDPKSLQGLFDSTAKQLAVVAMPVGLVAALAPFAFGPIFGEQWTIAGEVARALGIMFFCQLIVVPLSQTLQVVGKQGYQLAWDAARLVIVGISLSGSAVMGLGLVEAMYVFSFAMVGCYALLFTLCRRAVRMIGANG